MPPVPAMQSRKLQSLATVLLVALLAFGVGTARAITSSPIEVGEAPGLRPSAAAIAEVSPLTRANFEALLNRVIIRLREEAPYHRHHAAQEGVRISEAQYERALTHFARSRVISDAAWAEQMRGIWARCEQTDACTARLAEGSQPTTQVFVRASAVPNATHRRVLVPQLAALLEHEFAHVLLMEVGFAGNQDAFITTRWTLGAPDSALSSHVTCPASGARC